MAAFLFVVWQPAEHDPVCRSVLQDVVYFKLGLKPAVLIVTVLKLFSLLFTRVTLC